MPGSLCRESVSFSFFFLSLFGLLRSLEKGLEAAAVHEIVERDEVLSDAAQRRLVIRLSARVERRRFDGPYLIGLRPGLRGRIIIVLIKVRQRQPGELRPKLLAAQLARRRALQPLKKEVSDLPRGGI